MPYRMKALITFEDDGEQRRVGEVFTVTAPAKAAALRYQRKADFAAEDEKPKGRYRRRDLRADP